MGMNRDVYSFLLKTYSREPWHGAGFVFQTLMMYAAAPLLRITHRYLPLAKTDRARQPIVKTKRG